MRAHTFLFALLLAGAAWSAAAACVEDMGDMVEGGSGCMTCDDTKTACIECLGYHALKADGTCVKCTDPNCGVCKADDPNFCLGCWGADFYADFAGGWAADASGKCIQCPQGCSTCDATGACTGCGSYQGLVNGTCADCQVSNDPSQSCLQCDGDVTKCSECDLGYFLDASGTCQYCELEGCITCADADTCEECDSGYFVSPTNGTCAACAEGCDSCTDADTCDACAVDLGYANSTDPATPCVPCTDPNCAQCSQGPDACEYCEDDMGSGSYGVDVATGKCVACAVKDCQICSADASKCDICSDGLVFDGASGTCKPCSVANCSACSVDPTSQKEFCDICADGFDLDYDSGACVAAPADAAAAGPPAMAPM